MAGVTIDECNNRTHALPRKQHVATVPMLFVLYRVESILLCADIYSCKMHKQLQVLAVW